MREMEKNGTRRSTVVAINQSTTKKSKFFTKMDGNKRRACFTLRSFLRGYLVGKVKFNGYCSIFILFINYCSIMS